MKNIAIYGAGGFGKEIACVLNAINKQETKWNLIGFFDDGLPVGSANKYGKVLGGIQELNKYPTNLSIAIAIAKPEHLEKLVNDIKNPLIDFPNIIAPNVHFFDEETVTMGKGNIIFFGCRISCDCQIGNFNLMNGFVALGHDVSIGNFNVLNPSVRLSGEVKMGNNNFLGVQAIVLQKNKIGNNTKVAANSVIMRNTQDGFLYIGNPATIVRF